MSFETLHIDSKDFFDWVRNCRPKCDYVFFMAYDAEWFEENGRNVVLSYQMATASPEKTSNIIEYMKHGQRLTLAEIVELGIRSVTTEDTLNELRGRKVQVILISHHTTAEWSVLADRDESYITKRLVEVRGSPITDGNAIQIAISNGLPVDVQMFDTMLLAPASHRSLKQLSTLLGSEGDQKESVTQFYIGNMNLYLQDHPDKFEQYALKDSAITLRLFFMLQQALNDLVSGESGKFKLYRTLASAGVKSFTNNNPWFGKYRKELKYKFSREYQIIARSYYGGRNESYFIGRTNDYSETKNKIWIDIDFTGCYPTAMALSPLIDLEQEADFIPRKYMIDDVIAAELEAKSISPEIIARLREALAHSRVAFDKEMMTLQTKISWQIREKTIVYDNRLVNSWHHRWTKAKETKDDSIEKISIPGFARVHFKFPPDTQFPCLPIRHPEYGLLYVLEGETTVPATEIMLAMEAGAEINALTSFELPVKEAENKPVRFLLEHLADLAKKREEYKRKETSESKVMEKLLKEFTNSLYGKFSQSINPRRVYNAATGEKVELGESIVTEPCTAALATSLARAALSATLLGVERFNKGKAPAEQVTVISATTDGLLIGIPAPENFTVITDYYENNSSKLKKEVKHQLPEILERFGCSGLLDEINKYLPIRQMQNSRREMTGSNEILENKHLTDKIISVKTRGQIGKISNNDTVLIARFNLKPPLSEILVDPEEYKRVMDDRGVEKDSLDGDWIQGHLDEIENGRNAITTYSFITLNSFQKIAKSKGKLDLTKNINPRKINTDYDWKRKLIWADETRSRVLPYTRPYINTAEMLKHRNEMEYLRRAGKVARPENILHRIAVKGTSLNTRGGEPVAVTRLFLRGLLQGKIKAQHEPGSYTKAADKINTIWGSNKLTQPYPKNWTKNDFKNAQRAEWEPGCILPNITLRKLVRDLAEAFTVDPDTAEAAIFTIEEFEAINSRIIGYVITAIVRAPGMGITSFCNLQEKGLLPTRQKMVDTFRGQLTEEQVEACMAQHFIPGKLETFKAKTVKKIFYRLGIPSSDSEACARILAPPSQVTRAPRKNPGEQKCTDHFIMAILQPDIKNRDIKTSEVLDNLKKYGVTKNRYYQLKKGKFNPNSIKNTPGNRQQISRMAKALGHDPLPLIDVLVEK